MIVLFGDIRFDGRVKRMVEIARSLGEVCLVSTGADNDGQYPGIVHHKAVLRPNWGKVRRHLAFWKAVGAQAVRWKPDIVFAEDYFTTEPSWLAAKIARADLVYDAHELIIPEVDGRKMHPRDKFWYLLERFVISRASLVVAANPERAKLMEEHYRLQRAPTYMRNIPASASVTPSSRERALRSYPTMAPRSKDDTIVLYQGDVALARGLARFVAALDYLPDHYRLVIVGSGPDSDRLTRLAGKHTASGRYLAVGRVPNDQLISVASLAHVGIVTYPYDGLNNIYCAPNKVFEYAQAGLPILATDQPPIRALMTEFPFGHLLGESTTAKRIAEEIIAVAQGAAALKQLHAPFLAAYAPDLERARVTEAIEQSALGK